MTSMMSSFVYGSSGAAIDGASAMAGGGVGSGLETTLPIEFTTSPRPLTAPSTAGPTAPLATHRMAIESSTTDAAIAALIGSGISRRRSTRRYRARRVGDGWTGRVVTGFARPVEGGRGRTCGGRPPDRESIGAHCRMAGPVGSCASPVRPAPAGDRCLTATAPTTARTR